MTFSNAGLSTKMFLFRYKVHWTLFLWMFSLVGALVWDSMVSLEESLTDFLAMACVYAVSECIRRGEKLSHHYNDVIMTTIASQISSLTVVYSTVYSDADQRKHQSSASLAFVWGNHRDRWIPRTNGQLRGKCFHLMTSLWSCKCNKTLYLLRRDTLR